MKRTFLRRPAQKGDVLANFSEAKEKNTNNRPFVAHPALKIAHSKKLVPTEATLSVKPPASAEKGQEGGEEKMGSRRQAKEGS